MDYKQIIIVRKDLNMSIGKLSAQVSHGSIAFLTNAIKNGVKSYIKDNSYSFQFNLNDRGVYDNWINGGFTKIVLEAKNKTKLLKAINYAQELGLKEKEDYFLIRDNCLTELTPEDEDGRTLTVIGFRPLPENIAREISRHYYLYR